MRESEEEREEKNFYFFGQRHMMCINALISGPRQYVGSNSISKLSAMIAIGI
jgi:hypothetical protein